MNWEYFVLGVIFWQIFKALSLAINREIIERRQRRFLKLVNIEFKGHSDITFIAFDSSDKRSMAKLEKQVRERFNLPEVEAEPPEPSWRGGFRN